MISHHTCNNLISVVAASIATAMAQRVGAGVPMADAPTSAEQVSFGASAGLQPEESPPHTGAAASGADPVRAKAADDGPGADRLLAASKGVRSYGTLGNMPRRADRYTWHPDSMRFTAQLDGDTVELPLLSLRASRTSRRRRKALKLFLIYTSVRRQRGTASLTADLRAELCHVARRHDIVPIPQLCMQ